jgi:hypothetical protein
MGTFGMIVLIIIILIMASKASSNLSAGNMSAGIIDLAIAGGLGYLVWNDMQKKKQ